MRHELTRQVGGYHFHMELLETEVYAYRLHCSFQPAICTEVPFTRSHQNIPSGVFKAEHNNSNQTCHTENTKQHLTEHFKMPAKCEQIAIIHNIVILTLLFLYQFFWLLLLFPFLAFLLRHSLLALRSAVRSCLF